ncbi:MAG: IS30 family transposase [Bifidobacterium longum]
MDLRQYLARGRKRRTRKKGRKAKGPRIPMRAAHQRTAPRQSGLQEGVRPFGDSDTVVGAAPSRRCMNTGGAQEPQAVRPARRRQERVRHGQGRIRDFKDIPPAARVDRTWDNGTEASLHMLVDEALGMLTYFADPYSSWQRGSNENRNGSRRYLPKGTGFEDLAQEDLDAIVGESTTPP